MRFLVGLPCNCRTHNILILESYHRRLSINYVRRCDEFPANKNEYDYDMVWGSVMG